MCELSATLAAYEGSGYVLAPAGYGKTHLIAESTARSAGRQLILTHTYAGVNALRRKMRVLGVGDQLHHIDTIASWVLRLSRSYSGTSGWGKRTPRRQLTMERLVRFMRAPPRSRVYPQDRAGFL